MLRLVKYWHRLTRKVVDAPSLETFKVRSIFHLPQNRAATLSGG